MNNIRKRINKKDVIIFVILFIIGFLLYKKIICECYLSLDTWIIKKIGYFEYAKNYSFYDGRMFMGAIDILAGLIDLPEEVFYTIVRILSIGVMTLNVILVKKIIVEIKKPKNKYIEIFIYTISFLLVYNYSIIDVMSFYESFVISLSILFFILSSSNIILKKRYILGGIYCLIALFLYQGTINVYFAMSSLFIIISKENWKEKLKTIGIIIGIFVTCSLINLLFVSIYKIFIPNVIKNTTKRYSMNLIENLIENLKQTNELIINSVELFPKYIQLMFVVIITILSYIYSIKKKDMKVFFNVLTLSILVFFSVQILSMIYLRNINYGGGRTTWCIAAWISLIFIYLYCDTNIIEENNIYSKITILMVIIYLIINISNTIYISKLLIDANNIDREFSDKIINAVEEYEKENNIKVNNIYILNKSVHDYELNKIEGIYCRKKLLRFNDMSILEFTDRELVKQYLNEEDKNIFTKEDDDEIICKDDSVYVQNIY